MSGIRGERRINDDGREVLTGGLKAAETNKRKYGDGFYARIGQKGGRNGHTGGFAANPELAKRAGSIGGKRSSRKGIKNGMGKSRYKYKREWNEYEAAQ